MDSVATPRGIAYPHVPKSTATLVPGQFWSIPLSDGTFGCGRVIEVVAASQPGARRIFLAGVLDWHGSSPPDFDSIAGAGCFDQGKAHIVTITDTGGCVLGHRPLELDGIEAWTFRGAEFWRNSMVYCGTRPIRPQTPEDDTLPVASGWGRAVAWIRCEHKYVTRLSPAGWMCSYPEDDGCWEHLNWAIWHLMAPNTEQRSRFPNGGVAQGLADEFDHWYDAVISRPTLDVTGDLLTALQGVRSRIDSLPECQDDVELTDPEWSRLREVAAACKELCARKSAERIWARERATGQTSQG